jgi:hypothetical protein
MASDTTVAWPSDPNSLPFMLTENQVAELEGRSPRTLQRERVTGTGCPFVKIGKRIFYARDAVLERFARQFKSVADAKTRTPLTEVKAPVRSAKPRRAQAKAA